MQQKQHTDVTNILPSIKPDLSMAVREVLNYNNAVKSVRGGEATKNKWNKIKAKSKNKKQHKIRNKT